MATGQLSPLSIELSEQMRQQLRRMLVRLDEIRALAFTPNTWMPPVDVWEMEDAIIVRAELPGIAPEHLRVTLLDNRLKIEGRKERPKLTGNLLSELERPTRFLCLERTFGAFSFHISLRWPIEAERIAAQLAGGILQVRLPKASSSGREIAISITEQDRR